jgi:thiosulfate dehydrogenase
MNDSKIENGNCRRPKSGTGIAVALGVVVGLIAAPLAVSGAEMESSIARGGLLYDKWYKVIGEDEPTKAHPAYPADKKYAKKAKDNWRCKECHGWDYQGVDGAYSKGKHFSGIKGINGMAGADAAKIIAILKDDTHRYDGKMEDEDFTDLANFVSQGQVDMSQYIDSGSKAIKGADAEKGSAYFNTVCARCHSMNGTKPKDMDKTLGAQMGNPWEVMHKILNGHPGEPMPAMRAFGPQVVADILAHVATLPKEK